MKLKTAFAELRANWIANTAVKFGLLFFVGSLALIAWRWNKLPSAVPLWYSKPWGTEQLAHPLWLFILPLSTVFWFGVDFLIVAWHEHKYRIFTQALFLATFLVSFLSFVTLVKILFLVT